MNKTLPSVTVLIAARPGQTDIKAVNAARLLDYPAARLEIIIARGRQPSVQRNAALRAAQGDLIYFLDDDSVPPPDNLRRAITAFADPQVKMVGGPNLCPMDAPMLEQVFALVHASWLAFGPSRARYAKVGVTRVVGEKELILCNLLARREAILELGGFNEALYPNEENALMDELQKRGGKLLYDPEIIVHRRPRNNLKSFARMLLNYGRGRAEQVRLHPSLGSAMNFVPPLFCVYLLALLFLILAGKMALLWFALIPLFAYGIAVVGQAAVLAASGGLGPAVCAIPLMVLTHILYGAGFWRGLFTSLRPPAQAITSAVTLENVAMEDAGKK